MSIRAIIFLVMSGNVGALEAELRALAQMENANRSQLAQLLQLKFAEPLQVVVSRAKGDAKAMALDEAFGIVGKRLHPEAQALFQESTTHKEVLLHSTVKEHIADNSLHASNGRDRVLTSSTPKPAERAISFINKEFKQVQEVMDLKLLECGSFKIQKENDLYEVQDELDTIAIDLGLANAIVSKNLGVKEETLLELSNLQAELHTVKSECSLARSELEKSRSLLESDLAIVDRVISETKKTCQTALLQIHACVGPDAKTFFRIGSDLIQKQADQLKSSTAQQAFQQAMFAAYGMDSKFHAPPAFEKMGFDDDDSDDFPDMSWEQSVSHIQVAKSSADIPSGDVIVPDGQMCKGCALPPSCSELLDKMDTVRGQTSDSLDIKVEELTKHNTECETEVADLNSNIATANNVLSVAVEQFNKATGNVRGLEIQLDQGKEDKKAICKEMRQEYKQCHAILKGYEREICGFAKIRQAIYEKTLGSGNPPPLEIQDCEMGDWVVGQCSSTCKDQNGHGGIQLITRSPVRPWTNTTKEGKYGVSCPPSEVARDCANTPCPIDCEMRDWSGWSECTKQCGGGQQGRIRKIAVPAQHGGKECDATDEERTCNLESCDANCELSEWESWGPCTKSCKAGHGYRPGIQFRRKHIAVPSKGQGTCPNPRSKSRFGWRYCNNFVCPKDVKCVANADIIVLLDGSGSLRSWRGPKDANWKKELKFTEDLIKGSQLAKKDEFGHATDGLRFGVIQFAWRPKVISLITEDKDTLLSKVAAMKWPKGATFTGQALMKANQVFRIAGGGGSRLQIAILVTDGRASRRHWAYIGALHLRHSGARLIVIPVKNALRMRAEMCKWASKPCIENMLPTPRWDMLITKIRWYMSTLCPALQSPMT